MGLVGAGVGPVGENSLRDMLAEINFAEPGIVICRAELPASVGKFTSTASEHGLQVRAHGAVESGELTLLRPEFFHAPDEREDEAFHGRNDARAVAFAQNGRNTAVASEVRCDSVCAKRRLLGRQRGVAPVEQGSKAEICGPSLDREVKVVAGLTERRVETVIGRDLRPALATRGVSTHHAVPPRGIGMIAVDQAPQTGQENLFPPPLPGKVAGEADVGRGAADPVDQLLVGHVGEAAVESGSLVRRMAGARETIADAHVVGEAKAARVVAFSARQPHAVRVAVSIDEPIELIAHHPRVAGQFEKQVIDG